MTIFTSNLLNDADMIKALGSVAVPIPLFTDACFAGVGTDNEPLLVAIERKKIGDLCACILDGRLLFQLQNSKEAGADVLVLIAEVGEIRPNPDDGLLEVLVWGLNPRTMRRAQNWAPVRPTMTYSRFDQYLTELDYLAGVIVKRTRDVNETAMVIKSLWDNFQKTPEAHGSLKQMFKPPLPTVLLVRPSLVRRVASELPSIGWERSKVVAEHFSSVYAMVNASEKEWASLDGIGKKIAGDVVKAIGSLQK